MVGYKTIVKHCSNNFVSTRMNTQLKAVKAKTMAQNLLLRISCRFSVVIRKFYQRGMEIDDKMQKGDLNAYL